MGINRKITILIVFVSALCLVMGLVFFTTSAQRSAIISHPLGKWLLPSWHSLKKGYNLVHLPYWLLPSRIPTYYLSITPTQLEKLRDSLPFNSETLTYGDMLDDNKIFSKATFTSSADNYRQEIKIRYRGVIQNNWDAEKKAFRLKFPKENLFQGQDGLNLFLPDDRGYFAEPLNMYRAKKFGLFAPEFKFVRLNINQRDFGVYLAAEPWSKPLLARAKTIDTNNIFSNVDKIFAAGESLFKTSNVSDWKSYTAVNATGPFEELNALVNLVENAGDVEFADKIGTIFDLEKFYRWQIINTLAGSVHQGDTGNTVLIFRQENGKFEYVPWDVELYPSDEDFYNVNSTLAKRILSNKKFFNEYGELLEKYVSNEDNLNDDLVYYDGLYKQYKSEFYKDQAKIDNDYMFDNKVSEYRELVESNFENAKKLAMLSDFPATISIKRTSKLRFEGSFQYFNDIFLSVDQFLANNYQFTKEGSNTIKLLPGVHVFTRNVVVPRNLKFIIEPGAKLLFAPRTSLVSYSPVNAMGNIDAPIDIAALYPNGEPWGSFGVVNSIKNYFNFINVSGGSNVLMNGIPFTSQFSLQNSDSEVSNSIFENGHSDDGLHVVWGSVVIRNSIFRDNSYDGLDLDAVKNSKITGSKFYNLDVTKSGVDGDGLDVSSSENLEISDNQISNFGDKCISIGEKAEASIKNSILAECNYGLAVKDDSYVKVDNSTIIGNRTAGLTLYRKKQEFIMGGNAEVVNSILWGNPAEILIDETSYYPNKSGEWKNVVKSGISTLSIRDSVVKGGFDGINIKTSRPDFETKLPAPIYGSVKDKLY